MSVTTPELFSAGKPGKANHLTRQLLTSSGKYHSRLRSRSKASSCCYVLVMKAKKGQEDSITRPLLKDLVTRSKVESKLTLDSVKTNVGSTPLVQPDLFQDPGNGYNVDFVFPQD